MASPRLHFLPMNRAFIILGVGPNDPTICIAKGHADGKLVPLLCRRCLILSRIHSATHCRPCRFDIWREWPGFHTEVCTNSAGSPIFPLKFVLDVPIFLLRSSQVASRKICPLHHIRSNCTWRVLDCKL